MPPRRDAREVPVEAMRLAARLGRKGGGKGHAAAKHS
jgi:hypothetical protein